MIKSIKDVNVNNKTVLVRVDYNLPYDTQGKIADDRRIRASLGTVAYLVEQQAKVVLMTHSGRPGGKIIPALSLEPAAARLSELLKKEVIFVGECIGPEAEAAVTKANYGDVILLENLRFHAEETMNDMAFAKQLASVADLYVNESFATSHRAHASNTGICAFLPGVAGLTLLDELNAVSRETLLDAQKNPEDHRNLIVRVWGWSGHFVQLDKGYQEQIIERTSYRV